MDLRPGKTVSIFVGGEQLVGTPRSRATGQRYAETSLGGNGFLCNFSEIIRGGTRNLLGGFENANVSIAVCGCHVDLRTRLDGRASGAKKGSLVFENNAYRNAGQH